jgi:hypothetical protein
LIEEGADRLDIGRGIDLPLARLKEALPEGLTWYETK